MGRYWVLLLLAVLPLLSGGCHTLTGEEDNPLAEMVRPEPPAEEGKGYLGEGPTASVERGPAATTLLAEFRDAVRRLEEQKDQIEELLERVKGLEAERDGLRNDLAAERNLRAGAEAQRDQALMDLKEKNIRLLNLAYQKTRADCKRYELEIEKKKAENIREQFLADKGWKETWIEWLRQHQGKAAGNE